MGVWALYRIKFRPYVEVHSEADGRILDIQFLRKLTKRKYFEELEQPCPSDSESTTVGTDDDADDTA